MLYNLCKLCAGVCVAALLVASADSVSADIVLSHPDLLTFNGTSDYHVLDTVSTIGLEGQVDLKFKANQTTSGHLWYCCDAPGGSQAECRVYLTNGNISAAIWTASGYVGPDIHQAFMDTLSWHTLSLGWKSGGNLALEVDGLITVGALSGPLASFTSGSNNCHLLGAYHNSATHYGGFFNGQISDVVISNVMSIPEPASMVMLAASAVGLLAYAWRKRK
jgi:hypothetical protein